ncbi:YdiU family protein [Motilimonas sp. 1_MG-2023]|uniref:protein adenylyltransferase SelO n=1 Tax=Motilimonas sp. 1_MG-2023 TaxID=3062672 RepID=UPI0026E42AF2|nr:YdiU family protein [Motilimonas sp. 1_MG-2023]MDO6524591.1 YdiU family protein [Motilimonas sp. 1_MG-2023]
MNVASDVPMNNTLEQLNYVTLFSQLPDSFYQQVIPTPLLRPKLVHANTDVARLLNLDINELQRDKFTQLFSGNTLLNNMAPLAMKYAGHQFGIYNPALGDGRGLLLAQVKSDNGVIWDLHLKGAGKTPYSRQGDGRAVLRSSIREYLCSEAMHHLGIATTRALCLVDSEEPVWRERLETGATLVRVSESHIRFGHFEYLYHSNQHHLLPVLADAVIAQHYPHLVNEPEPYLALFKQVISTTATLIAQWQGVGFCHGVMNTDNMSILGQTFDYGPFAFLDSYQADYICNHSDYEGRYAFNRQADIAQWNLSALGYALTPLISNQSLNDALAEFEPQLVHQYRSLLQSKLGFSEHQEQDGDLIRTLFNLLAANQVDYTCFFRRLANTVGPEQMYDLFEDQRGFSEWFDRYMLRLSQDSMPASTRKLSMLSHNPKYILRNHLAQAAIEQAEQGDYNEIARLFALLQHPFDEQMEHHQYSQPPAKGTQQRPLSCSS